MASRKKKTSLRDRLADWYYEIDWAWWRQSGLRSSWVLGVALLIGGWLLGVPRLQAHIAERSIAVDQEVRFLDPPAWMNGDLEAWLVITARQALQQDPFRRGDLIACHNALLETGCFDHISQVRRASKNLVEIQATFLHPFALVKDEDGDHLVDPKGRLLPAGYRVGSSSHFIVITGKKFDRPLRPGLQWDGTDITDALHMIRMISDRPWWPQIKSIDISDVDRITMTTSRNCKIIWGAAPGEEAVGEVAAEKKIQRLDFYDREYGRIDVDCPTELDITDPKVVTAR